MALFISLAASLSRDFTTSRVVFIPAGATSSIITHLRNFGFNVNAFDRYIISMMGQIQSGWIDIGTTRLSKGDFLYRLTTAKAALISITLIPGETTEYFLAALSKELGLDFYKLLDATHKNSPIKEGFLIPETYKIPRGITETHLAHYLTSTAAAQHRARSIKIFGEYDAKKWAQYLITASIIQKEAASASEMPVVASVIYNRLKKGMKLQMDGTLNYGLYSHTPITAERIRTDKSPYNTYIYAGLPPTPVCVVSLDAITAAIFPKKTDYLYFVRDKKTGRHQFSKSYDQHIKNIKK